MIHWICWRVWKWGHLWETNGLWSCPMIFRSQKACVALSTYPCCIAFSPYPLCGNQFWCIQKNGILCYMIFWTMHMLGWTGPSDRYLLFGFGVCWFHPDLCCFITDSLPTLLLWCKSSGNQSNGCCGYSSFLDEFPMKCSHFPGTSSFPHHTWPAAWSGPAGRGSCWGPWHKLHILRIYCLAMWRH